MTKKYYDEHFDQYFDSKEEVINKYYENSSSNLEESRLTIEEYVDQNIEEIDLEHEINYLIAGSINRHVRRNKVALLTSVAIKNEIMAGLKKLGVIK